MGQVVVPDAENAVAVALDSRIADHVTFGFDALAAIELYHETGRVTDEVSNVAVDGHLTTELVLGEAAVP